MNECYIGIKIIWRHWSTTTITTMADHSQRRQKSPTSAAHKALRPTPSSSIEGRRPPEQAEFFLRGWGGVWPSTHSDVMAIHHCWDPGQRSALRAIHPPNTPKIKSYCSGGHCPSIWRVSTRRTASCGALDGHFHCRRWRPWLWRCFVACRTSPPKTVGHVICTYDPTLELNHNDSSVNMFATGQSSRKN